MASPLCETSSETDLLELSDNCLETETDEGSGGITGSVELIPKKNTKSPVWNYFGVTPKEDQPIIAFQSVDCVSKMYQQNLATPAT